MTTIYDLNVLSITNKYKKKVETQLPYLQELTGYNNEKLWYMLLSPKEKKAMRNEIFIMANERKNTLISLNRPSTKLEELEYKQTSFLIEKTKQDKKRNH